MNQAFFSSIPNEIREATVDSARKTSFQNKDDWINDLKAQF